MCWFYMGKDIAQIALDPPPLSNGQTILASPYTPSQTWEKSPPNHPGKPLRPHANVGKKCSKPSSQAFTSPPPDNAHMETTNFKKGLPLQVRLF